MYKDSDCTIVIAIVHWHKNIIVVQKLTLVVELEPFVFPFQAAIAQVPNLIVVSSTYSSREQLTKILAAPLWLLSWIDTYVVKLTLVVTL